MVTQNIFQCKLVNGATGIADDLSYLAEMRRNMIQIPEPYGTVYDEQPDSRFDSSSLKYLSLVTVGQNWGFHQIQR